MAIEDGAGGVGNRFVHVVAVNEHCVEAGDTAALGRTSPLEKLGQHRER